MSNEGVGTLRAASEDFSLTQIPQIPQMLLIFREIHEICVRHNYNETIRTQHADVPTKLKTQPFYQSEKQTVEKLLNIPIL